MIICIGPVCIPLWGLLPFLAVWLAPVWNTIKRWLVKPFSERIGLNHLDRLGFEVQVDEASKGEPKASIEGDPAETEGSDELQKAAPFPPSGLRLRRTAQKTSSELIQLKDADHWQTLLASSRDDGKHVFS
jgi:thioredoxin 1